MVAGTSLLVIIAVMSLVHKRRRIDVDASDDKDLPLPGEEFLQVLCIQCGTIFNCVAALVLACGQCQCSRPIKDRTAPGHFPRADGGMALSSFARLSAV